MTLLFVQVGAELVPVQLQPPDWDIPRQQLEAAFTDRTKFVLVNTPHNPTGKVQQANYGGSEAQAPYTLLCACVLECNTAFPVSAAACLTPNPLTH